MFSFFFQDANKLKMQMNKTTLDTSKEKKINNNHLSRNETHFKKKNFKMKRYFQSIISLHALKLALNKSMRASGNEQGINKLWPKQNRFAKEDPKSFFDLHNIL